MEQQKSPFQQAFLYLYFLMLSADNVADIKELELGKKIIKIESMNYEEVMMQMDQLTKVPRNEIFHEAVQLLKRISKAEQLKCLAYSRLIAQSDGAYDDREKDLLHELGLNEMKVTLQEIADTEKRLSREVLGNDN
jgi:hypothetical protein